MNENITLEAYENIVRESTINHIKQLATPLKGVKVVHVNSTRLGGGVAEILNKLLPLKRSLGIDAEWEIITGEGDFYKCTKGFHNALQGNKVKLSEDLYNIYEETNRENAQKLHDKLNEADIVFIHDPQPAKLLHHFPNRKGKWLWRCHIDASRPYRPVWKYLKKIVSDYDASIFSLADFAQPLPHLQYLISPSIDPLAEKNIDLSDEEIIEVCKKYGIDTERPMIIQVSRFDSFKDPVGVIEGFKIAKKFHPKLQLVLAGGTADDDPEGAAVLKEVERAAENVDDVNILLLPPDAHRIINALQRASDIILQKSVKEGFGLTVTEALWKGKPVIGGDTGGIRLQVLNHNTGFLVSSPEGAALRIRYLYNNQEKMKKMGLLGKEFVRENFLITRHLREYLTLMNAMINFQGKDRMVLYNN
ncbi:MAG: glycosyltransferase [Candidatus Muiribacteriota bacterium]